MAKEGECENCGIYGVVELHHIIKKSQAKFLEKCKLNFKYLCCNCHRGTYGVHGINGRKLDLKIRLEMQQNIEILLDKQYFNRKQIQNRLEISEKATDSLCKTIKQHKGEFAREDILIGIMGRLVTENEVTELNESTSYI